MGEPRDVKEFEFRGLRNIQIFQKSDFMDCQDIKEAQCWQFVACANRFGRVFALTPKKELLCFQTAEIDTIARTRDTGSVPMPNFPRKSVDLESSVNGKISVPTHLSISSDDSTLGVGVSKGNTPFVLMFDVRAFSDENTGPIRPFLEVRLSSRDGAKLADFQWNPGMAEMFCAACTDGSLMTGQIRGDGKGFEILGSAGLTLAAPTCLCWSPKGKQVVVGKTDGTLTQYKQNLEMAKSIPPPPLKNISSSDQSSAGDTTRCVNVCWLSTSQFAVLYAPRSKPAQISLCVLTLSKERPPTWTSFDDICFGYGDLLPPRYIMHHIPAWQMLVCTSTVAAETGILGSPDKGVPDAALWVPWSLEETGRAELPSLGSDPHALGSALGYSSQRSIDLEDGTSKTGSPMLFLVSTDGLLCPYSLVNELPLAAGTSLTMKPVFLTVNGMRDPLPLAPTAPTPAQPVSRPGIPLSASNVANPVLTAQLTQKPVFTAPQKPFGALQQPFGGGQAAAEPVKPLQETRQPLKIPVQQPRLVQAPEPVRKPPAAAPAPAPKMDGNTGGGRPGEASASPEVLELRKFVSEEIRRFERKLALVKQKLSKPIESVGSREELIELPKCSADADKDCGLLRERSGELREWSGGLRQNLLDDLASLEGGRVLADRVDTPELFYLVKHRPLAPGLERRAREYEMSLRDLEDTMADLEMTVKNVRMEGGTSLPSSPSYGSGKGKSVELVYHTISNMQAVMGEQKKRMARLTLNMNRLRADRRGGGAPRYHPVSTTPSKMEELTDGMKRTKIGQHPKSGSAAAYSSPPTRIAMLSSARAGGLDRTGTVQSNLHKTLVNCPRKMDPESQNRVREFLMGRQTTPHRSTVPNLPPPKFKWPEPRAEKSGLAQKTSRDDWTDDKPDGGKIPTANPIPQRKTSAFTPVSQQKPVQSKPVSMERSDPARKPVQQPLTPLGSSSSFSFVKPKATQGIQPTTQTASAKPVPVQPSFSFTSPSSAAPNKPVSSSSSGGFKFNWGAGSLQQTAPFKSNPSTGAPANVTVAKPVPKPVAVEQPQPQRKPQSPPKAAVPFAGFSIGKPLGTSTPAVKPTAELVLARKNVGGQPVVVQKDKEPETSENQGLIPMQKPVSETLQNPVVENQYSAAKPVEQEKPVSTVEAQTPVVSASADEKTPEKSTVAEQEETAKRAVSKAAVARTLDVSATSEKPQGTPPVAPPAETPEISPVAAEAKAVKPPEPSSKEAEKQPVPAAPPALPQPDNSDVNTTMEDGMMEEETPAPAPPPASPFGGSFGAGIGGSPQASSGGGGGFFSGLGGKPSAEAANRNPFGSGLAFGASTSSGNKSIFGGNSLLSGGSASFGGSFGGGGQNQSGGPFSSGANQSSSSFSGFGGGLGSPPKFAQQTSAFGGSPAFGGGTGFGSSPVFGGAVSGGQTSFGGSPAFGGGASMGQTGKVFGATAGGTSSFGAAGFGALAAQGGGGGGSGFGALTSMGSSTFGGSGGFTGTSPAQGSIFGGGSPSDGPIPSEAQFAEEKTMSSSGFRMVNLDLASHDLYATVFNILESCSLPTKGLSAPPASYKPHVISDLPRDWTDEDEEQIRIFWRRKSGELRKRHERQKSLEYWMRKLGEEASTARAKYQAVNVIVEIIVKDLCERTGLRDIFWENDWSLTHSRSCLTALKRILESESTTKDECLVSWGIMDRRIKFCSSGTYLSMEGDLYFGSEDVPETWLWLLNSVRSSGRSLEDSIKDLKKMERKLSGVLGGAKISAKPGTSMNGFRSWLGTLTQSVRSSGRNTLRHNLVTDNVEVVVQSEADSLFMSDSGEIFVPANCSPEKLIQFLKDNVPNAKSRQLEHKKRKEVLDTLTADVTGSLELSSLTWDSFVPHEELESCLERLVDLDESRKELLRGQRIHVTRQSSFCLLSDGRVASEGSGNADARIQEICSGSILLKEFPRSLISVTIQELQNDGSLGITHKLDEQFVKHQMSEFSMEWNPNVELSMSAGVNSCCLALMDAGVPMSSLFCAVTVCVMEDGEMWLDPSKEREAQAVNRMNFAFKNGSGTGRMDISGCWTEGSFSVETFRKAKAVASKPAEEIFEFFREAILKKYSRDRKNAV